MTDLASLWIYRPVTDAASAKPVFEIKIEMDGQEVVRLGKGRSWVGHVEPGRHILRAHNTHMARFVSPPLELVLVPGDDVRLETKFPFWALTVTPSLVRTGGGMTGSPVLPAAPRLAAQVLGVTETHRSEEPIGAETRRIDNTPGVGRLTRTIRVTKEWSHMVSLDLHASHAVTTSAQIGPNWLALKASIEQSLERTYAISVSRREESVEEISVEIKPGADITLILTWKRIWQHGLAHVLTQGSQTDVPFRMAVGVTFDQSTR